MENKEPTQERWVFGGVRVHQNKRVHYWLSPNGEGRYFKAAGSYAVGAVYNARVTRDDDGGTYLHGRPGYTGDRSEDEELRDQLSAKTRAAELQLGLDARERAAKREDPVELAIKRLEYLTASMHPSSRTAFATYVAVRLARAWK